MLPTPIKILLNLFDMLGVFTEFPPQNCLQKCRYACAGAVFLFVFNATINNYNWYTLLSIADQINSNLQVYGGLLTYSIIVIDAIIYRRKHSKFWLQFQECFTLFKLHQTYYKWNQIILQFVVLFVIFCINVSIALTIISIDDMIELVAVFIVVRMYHIRIIQYVIYVEIIRGNIKMIYLRIIELAVSRGKEIEFLKEIRGIYLNTFDMVDGLNESFGVSQCAVVSFCFFLLLSDTNWSYLHLSEQTLILTTSNVPVQFRILEQNISMLFDA